MIAPLLEDAVYPEECVQRAAASALASLVEGHRDQTAVVLDRLLELYQDKLQVSGTRRDVTGRGRMVPEDDRGSFRTGVPVPWFASDHVKQRS